MELRLTTDELNLLVRILQEARDSIAPGTPRAGAVLLLDKVLARDLHLDTDELDTLVDLLNHVSRAVRSGPPGKNSGPDAWLLQSLQDKVTEACVMI